MSTPSSTTSTASAFDYINNSALSTDSKFSTLQDSITNCFNESIPHTLVPTSARDKPWITPFIKNLIHERWAAYRARNFTRYRKLASLVKKYIDKAKLSWARRASNISDLWSKVHSVLGTNDSNPLSNLYCDSTSPSSLANAINNHFTSVFEASDLSNSNNFSNDGATPTFSETDVLLEIKKYSSQKASGLDGVPTVLYKAIAAIISKPLCQLFNSSLQNGVFSSCWKHDKVIALPKCKNPTIKDLRPIFLLPFYSKIFEKVVYKHFRPLFIDQFGSSQFGFRPHSSTCHALCGDLVSQELCSVELCLYRYFLYKRSNIDLDIQSLTCLISVLGMNITMAS